MEQVSSEIVNVAFVNSKHNHKIKIHKDSAVIMTAGSAKCSQNQCTCKHHCAISIHVPNKQAARDFKLDY